MAANRFDVDWIGAGPQLPRRQQGTQNGTSWPRGRLGDGLEIVFQGLLRGFPAQDLPNS
jgi:hypothetical protein